MTAFDIDALTVRFPEHTALDSVVTTLPRDAIAVIVGPNGCGKSTLLRSLARLARPSAGRVLLDGEDVSRIDRRTFAQRVALLPQGPQAPDNLSVIDLVARGRDPYRRWFDQWSRPDEDIVADALRRHPVEALDTRELFGPAADTGDASSVQLWPHRHGTDAMFAAALRVTGPR